eukprot:TRINITY_DN59766_c0_g1_i1.p1 TRINITY_DN59766_c0_g1~~TRINITY_DN59766_c0_g1_i1.p1  ORF type:complete len:417 (+),score=86.04 TRINITY_DN59766_c0_g1_i1:159-1409(+)
MASRAAFLVAAAVLVQLPLCGAVRSIQSQAVDSFDEDGPYDSDANITVTVSPEIAETRKEYYYTWAEKAHHWMRKALLRLSSGRKLVTKWFRLQKFKDAEYYDVVAQIRLRLTDMMKSLENLYIEKGTKEDCQLQRKRGGSHGTLAYVYPGQKHGNAWNIHVCDYATEFKGDISTKTLIHEVSHHRGTKDHAYGKSACLKLPWQEAVQNADSYALFVYDLLKHKKEDGNFLYEEGSGTPHPYCNTACDATSFTFNGSEAELDLYAPIGSCMKCEAKTKRDGVAGWVNWAASMGEEAQDEGVCDDGSTVYKMIKDGDCDTYGCDYLHHHSTCKEAAHALGIPYELLSQHRISSETEPYGCHVTAYGLFFNRNRRSDVDAQPHSRMICECPTSEKFGETFRANVCCTVHECEIPDNKR